MQRRKRKKNSIKRVLFILDPISSLDLKWDTSLALLRELVHRGCAVWAADTRDLWYEGKTVYAQAKRLIPLPHYRFRAVPSPQLVLRNLDLVLIRKEPPFNMDYIYMTYLLDQVKPHVPVLNDPQGIRNANEKLSTLHFNAWKPPTLVTHSTERILAFQRKLRSDIVLKPLDQKGGKGILLAKYRSPSIRKMIRQATKREKETVIVQRFMKAARMADKRLLILNGRILVAYEKRPAKGDFRANLSVGGSCHPTRITAKDRKLVREIRPYLVKEGLYFVGLDVLRDKVIEMNVTCPAGIPEAQVLYPRLKLVEVWANFLEDFAARRAYRAKR